MSVDYFAPQLDGFDFIQFKLSNGDLSKVATIENTSIDKCMSWYYILKVNELNRMKYNIADIEKHAAT